MFDAITIPFGCKMLYNVVELKEGVTMDDVELTLGELCNTVKNTYGDEDGGFIAGQIFKFSGFVSSEGSLTPEEEDEETGEHVAIITYWKSFEQHEKSHADAIFKEKFCNLAKLSSATFEIGYELLWQGIPEK